MKLNRDSAHLFCALILLASSAAMADGKVLTRASVDKKSITIGDDLQYNLTVDFPAGYTYTAPDFQTIFLNFEIRNQKAKKSKKHAEYRLTLTAYTTGEVKINPFEMEFTSPAGEKEKISRPEIAVTVKFLEPGKGDTNEIRDIKPPILPSLSPLVYAALAALAAAAAYFLFRKRAPGKAGSAAALQNPAVSPEELANRRFAELEARKLAEQGLMKEFYVELSNIIRLYLAGSYGVPVVERTTDELFNDLRKMVSMKRNIEIREFLESSDIVKFAKYVPGINESRGDLERAKQIVNARESAEAAGL